MAVPIQEAEGLARQILGELAIKIDPKLFKQMYAMIGLNGRALVEKSDLYEFICNFIIRSLNKDVHINPKYMADTIRKGQYYVKKLIETYKKDALDYLTLCDLTKKMYRSFNLNADGTLDKYEMRHLLEALSNEMCTISLEANVLTFKQWFQRFDADGSDQVTLTELVDSLC